MTRRMYGGLRRAYLDGDRHTLAMFGRRGARANRERLKRKKLEDAAYRELDKQDLATGMQQAAEGRNEHICPID